MQTQVCGPRGCPSPLCARDFLCVILETHFREEPLQPRFPFRELASIERLQLPPKPALLKINPAVQTIHPVC